MAMSTVDKAVRTPRSRPLEGPTSMAQALGCGPTMASNDEAWRDIAVCAWSVSVGEFELTPIPEICLTLNTSIPIRYRVGRDVQSGYCGPGQICVMAPETRTSFVHEGTLSGMSMHLSTSRLRDLLGTKDGRRAASIVKTRLGIDDPFVWGAAEALVSEIRFPTERGPLYANAIADALSLHLVRSGAAYDDFSPNPPGLSAKALRGIRDRIEASLETGISLAELAGELGMSRHQFTRAFQRATGMPPYRYLTQRRIERSKTLLRQSELALVDIALTCGFASQSHFCDRFHASTGVSPGRYRRGE